MKKLIVIGLLIFCSINAAYARSIKKALQVTPAFVKNFEKIQHTVFTPSGVMKLNDKVHKLGHRLDHLNKTIDAVDSSVYGRLRRIAFLEGQALQQNHRTTNLEVKLSQMSDDMSNLRGSSLFYLALLPTIGILRAKLEYLSSHQECPPFINGTEDYQAFDKKYELPEYR